MPDIIHCPSCHRQLQLPENFGGRQVQCPKCAATFPVSSASAVPQPRREEPEPPPPADLGPAPRRRPPYRRERYDDDYADDYDDGYDRRHYLPHRGSTILTLGILALFPCWPILGPIAWIMGNADLKEIRAGRMDPRGESYTNAGRVCGIVATCVGYGLFCLWLLLVVTGGRLRFH